MIIIAIAISFIFFSVVWYIKRLNISNELNIVDVLSRYNLQKFNIVYDNNTSKINYNNLNTNVRQYIWYSIVKKFSHNLHSLNLHDFIQLKNFILNKSGGFNILLDKHGQILNVPLEIKKIL